MEIKLRVKAREYGAQQVEALGFASKVEFELDDGSIVEVQHPWLWDDDVQAAYDAVRFGTDIDQDENGEPITPAKIKGKPADPYNARLARAILGQKEHRRFLAGGGKSSQIVLATELLRKKSVEAEETADPKDGQS